MTDLTPPLLLEQLQSAETLKIAVLTLIGALTGMLGPVLVAHYAQSRTTSDSDSVSDDLETEASESAVNGRTVGDPEMDTRADTLADTDSEYNFDPEEGTNGAPERDTAVTSAERESDGLGEEKRIDLGGFLELDDQSSSDPESESDLDEVADPSDYQQELLAPASIGWETRAARVGEQWVSTSQSTLTIRKMAI